MKTVKKITSLCLVIVLLLSGLGFTINKMVCLKSGKTKISFTHVTDCCNKKQSSQSRIKSNCCDLKNTTFDLDDFSSSKNVNTPIADNFVLAIWQNNIVATTPCKNTSVLSYNDLPPPLYGRQLLAIISILTI